MYSFDCRVSETEPLRLPKVYRIHSSCNDGVKIVVEMHEELLKIDKDTDIAIEINIERERCLEHEFCGKGHVVSITKFDKKYRLIISIGGLLVVVNELDKKPGLEPVQEVYVGLSRRSET